RRAGHARRTERKLRASRGLRATFWNHAAIDSRRWRTGGSSGRGSRRRGGRRAGIRRAGAGPLSDSALSSALVGGFYRSGLESRHWRRPHAALGCVAGAERLLGGLDAHPAAAALIGPTRLAVRYAGTRACGTPPDDDEGGGEHRHEERHPAG